MICCKCLADEATYQASWKLTLAPNFPPWNSGRSWNAVIFLGGFVMSYYFPVTNFELVNSSIQFFIKEGGSAFVGRFFLNLQKKDICCFIVKGDLLKSLKKNHPRFIWNPKKWASISSILAKSSGFEAFIECVAACRVVRVLDWPQIRRDTWFIG